MITFKPSRILNESSQILGLTVTDLIFVMSAYVFFQLILFPFHLEMFALLIAIFLVILLIPIRLKYRRHIIRDFLMSTYHSVFKEGFYHVS